MSAGLFVISKYAASYFGGGEIHPIRVQPETISAAVGGTTNAAPGGEITNPISAVVSRSRRGRGLMPRIVRLRFPASGQPTGYTPSGVTTIPALNQAFWDACTDGTTVAYLGAGCTVVGRSEEKVK